MQRFAGRVALITGGTRGIGLAIARRVVAEGGSVVVTGRDEAQLAASVAELGGRASGVPGKVHDAAHRDAAIAHTIDRFGALHHLVNNAGINPAYGPLAELDPAAARKIFEVNVLAALEWARAAVAATTVPPRDTPPPDNERPADTPPPTTLRSVLNLASVAGTTASPDIAFYGVSKAALINLTQQLAHELAPAIRVNALAPAVIRTKLARALYEGREAEAAARYPLARLGEPDDVAGPAAFLLSDDAAWITGQTLLVDGGSSLHPGL
ncbi:SDR family oxidoreductase [Myceligenerans crystallogenes]|uniref:SDR family oxidoreductase n=1 Tax=Myceligenerans crystallogenes TaxID=316335 RepID=A0ABP4ZIZ8_9MICO